MEQSVSDLLQSLPLGEHPKKSEQLEVSQTSLHLRGWKGFGPAVSMSLMFIWCPEKADASPPKTKGRNTKRRMSVIKIQFQVKLIY